MNNDTRFTPFRLLLVSLVSLAFPAGPGFAASSDAPPTDRFGGNLALVTRSTGHFRVEQSKGRWWLITPEGHRMVALGVNHLSEMKNAAIHSRTILAQRFGQNWPLVFAEVERQCRAWGFNCAGFQTPVEMRGTMPYVISTSFMAASFWQNPLAYVDVFTPAFAAEAEAKAMAAAAEMKANPMAIAWTWTDSTSWDLKFTRETRGTDYVFFMRELPADSPGRQRYTAFLRERHGDDLARLNTAYGADFPSFEAVGGAKLDRNRETVFADDREFLRLIARHYFEAIALPFRREHPTGLLMGDRFHLRDHPDEVLQEAAKFIDVLGIQPGDHFFAPLEKLTRPDETWFDTAEFDRLHKLTGKPIIIADHQCGFFEQHTPKTGGWFQYATADEAAASYDHFLRNAFARPYLIGYFRCQYLTIYKDQLKRYKQGLLRPDGTPFEDYVERMQETNRHILHLVR
ncbi:MAG: hypothetical protein Q8N18_20050 [Opitutaceae bacterium]|nr:hypothetical protein [Opitutaceae bacterium]